MGPTLRMMSITRILIGSTRTTLSSTVAYLRTWTDESSPCASIGKVSNTAERGTAAPTVNGMSAARCRETTGWRASAQDSVQYVEVVALLLRGALHRLQQPGQSLAASWPTTPAKLPPRTSARRCRRSCIHSDRTLTRRWRTVSCSLSAAQPPLRLHMPHTGLRRPTGAPSVTTSPDKRMR